MWGSEGLLPLYSLTVFLRESGDHNFVGVGVQPAPYKGEKL